MFRIEWKESAIKDLQKLEAGISSRILKAVESLQENPFSKDFKKLKGTQNHHRLRVGSYRIIISLEDDLLSVLKIGRRENIYG